VLAFVSIAGCSVPLSGAKNPAFRELLFGYHSLDPEQARTRRVSAGVDLRAQERLRGITIGVSDLRILDVPSDAMRAVPCDVGVAWPLGIRWRASDGACESLGWFTHEQPAPGGADGAPNFTHQLGLGALVDWTDTSQGLSVGFSSATEIRVDPDSCGAFLLDYRSRFSRQGKLRSLGDKEGVCEK
jgi:hypothetical protein